MGKAEKPEKTNKKQKHFWKDFKAELKKVIWPTRSQIVNNTIIVIIIVLIVTAIVFALDFVFEAFNKYGINKLKEAVQNTVVSNDTNNTNNENTTDNNNQNETNTDNNAENTSAGGNNGEENTEPENNNTENNQTPDDTAKVENVSE